VFLVLALVAIASASRVRVKGTFEKSDFSAFKAKYNKSYPAGEELMRQERYLRNIAEINQHNAEYDQGKWTFWQGENEFIDWNQEEYDRRNGYIEGEIKTTTPYVPTGNEPDSRDWREDGAVGPVKNQGQCGSCWAFGTVGALEGQLFIVNGALGDCAEQQLVSCDSTYSGCNGGGPAFDYIQNNAENGLDTTASYPYTARDDSCDTAKTQDGQNVCAVIKGSSSASRGEPQLKEAVGNVGPITIGVNASPSSFGRYAGGVYDDPACSTQGNHMVTAVGYDTAANYWIVKNSWGRSWGEDGYIRFIYGKEMCGVGYCMAVWPVL